MAMGLGIRLRCRPLLPRLQPGEPNEEVRPDRGLRPALGPGMGHPAYPAPIVEHKFARQRAIDTYKAALADA